MAVAGRCIKQENQINLYCDPCMYVKESVEAIGFCSQCIEYLCPDCMNYHKKIKATREHNLYTGEDLPVDKSPFERMHSMTKCSCHSDQTIMYLCNDHSEHICLKCAKGRHITCACTEITVLVNEEKAREVMSRYLSISNDSDIDTLQNEIQTNLQTLSEEREHALQKRRRLIKLLRKITENLELSCLEVEIVLTETTDTLKERHSQNVVKIDEHRRVKTFLQTVMKFGSPFHQYLASLEIQNSDLEQGFTENHNKIYYLEDSIGYNIPTILEEMSKMPFKVTIKQKNLIENETTVSGSNDLARENDDEIIVCSGNHMKDMQVQQRDSLNMSPTVTPKNARALSLPQKEAYKTTVLKKGTKAGLTAHEICFEGPGFTGEDIDLATTARGVFVVTLRFSGSVLFFDEAFNLTKVMGLPYDVLGVCCIDEFRIATLWLDKKIRKYSIKGKTVRMYHDFTLPKNCHCITNHGKDEIICLYTDTLSDKNQAGEKSTICIEKRDQFSGALSTKIAVEMKINNLSVWKVFTAPSKGEIFISNGEKVKVLSPSGSELREMDMNCSGIVSIAGDSMDNLLMFNKPTNSVFTLKGDHQVNTYSVQKLDAITMTYSQKLKSLVLFGFRPPTET